MNKIGYKRKKGSFINFLVVLSVAGAFFLLKTPFINTVLGIKSEFSEKIIFASLLLEKPKKTVDYYWENYIRHDDDYETDKNNFEKNEKPIVDSLEIPQKAPEISSSKPCTKENIISSQPETQKTPPKKTPPMIEPKYRGTILEQRFGGADNQCFVKKDGVYIRNYTDLTAEQILGILEKKASIKFENTTAPQVLIYHTHATESFEEYDSKYYDIRGNWRSTDNNKNMIAVGDALEKALKAKGIGVIHDYTHHDYPSYNGSYSRSAETVKKYLKEYPTIKVALDLHRDGIERENHEIVKSKAEINGEKASQVMVVCACDENHQVLPYWEENFRFGMDITTALESRYKGLTRPLYLCNARYNMDLSQGLLILEFGTNANTVEEAKITANAVGEVLGDLLKSYREE